LIANHRKERDILEQNNERWKDDERRDDFISFLDGLACSRLYDAGEEKGSNVSDNCNLKD
jgi:hypothetical protein